MTQDVYKSYMTLKNEYRVFSTNAIHHCILLSCTTLLYSIHIWHKKPLHVVYVCYLVWKGP